MQRCANPADCQFFSSWQNAPASRRRSSFELRHLTPLAPQNNNAILSPKRKSFMHKVLIIIGDATETVDTLYPYYRLQEGGFEPVVAAPEKRKYQMVMHEVKPGWTITKEWEGYTINADVTFSEIRPEDYIGIFFSGGRAPEYIREDESLLTTTRYFFEKNLPIASVCHGVEIPARAGCVKGRRMATVPKCKFDLEVCGGIFVNEPCVVDGNMVSGRTFHDHGHYMGAWMRLLEEERKRRDHV
jgi:protease I